MGIRILRKPLSRELLKSNPDCWFLFGDNTVGRGKKGQAVIRGMSNALGVPTKWFPSKEDSAYFDDSEYTRITEQYIQPAFDLIVGHLSQGATVYYPEAGLGTGLAAMDIYCPQIKYYLDYKIQMLFEKYGDPDFEEFPDHLRRRRYPVLCKSEHLPS